jgi:hypothetical protein
MPDPADGFFFYVSAPLLAEPSISRGTMMGYPCLRVDGAFFASSEHQTGHLIVKLPHARVQQLIHSGIGQPFSPNGRTFREWVLITDRDENRWTQLLEEALTFVGGSTR